jgi:hypothetical protein
MRMSRLHAMFATYANWVITGELDCKSGLLQCLNCSGAILHHIFLRTLQHIWFEWCYKRRCIRIYPWDFFLGGGMQSLGRSVAQCVSSCVYRKWKEKKTKLWQRPSLTVQTKRRCEPTRSRMHESTVNHAWATSVLSSWLPSKGHVRHECNQE